MSRFTCDFDGGADAGSAPSRPSAERRRCRCSSVRGIVLAEKAGIRGRAGDSSRALCYDSRRLAAGGRARECEPSDGAVTRFLQPSAPHDRHASDRRIAALAGPALATGRRLARALPAADARARAARRVGARRGACRGRNRRGDRGVAGGRPERHRAERRGRDHCLQSGQGDRRHRLHRTATRARQHRRFRAGSAGGERRQGALDRTAHRTGSGRRARRPGTPRALDSGPRPLSPMGPRRRRRDRDGPCRGRGRARGRSADREQRRLDRRPQRIGVRLRKLEWLLRRLSQLAPSHRLLGDRRRRRRRDAARLLVHGGARRGRSRSSATSSVAPRASAPRDASVRGSCRRRNARCCSRRRKPPT